jgi:hypothetical protein
MTRDDDFEPKLGSIRKSGDSIHGRFAQEVERAIALESGRKRRGASCRRRTFDGSRIGRGAGVGRVLASRDRYAALRTRRVVIKTRIIKLAGRGLPQRGPDPSALSPARRRHPRGAAWRRLRCEARPGRRRGLARAVRWRPSSASSSRPKTRSSTRISST